MSIETLLPLEKIAHNASIPRKQRRSRFFQVASLILLTIALIGFSRTLFLRPWYPVPDLPWYLLVHGSLMTAWLVLFVAQTSLVAAHRIDLHRRLGILGGFLAATLAIFGFMTVLKFPAHLERSVISTDGSPTLPVPVATAILWGDLGSLIFYSCAVATALLMTRRRPEVHKRLLLVASILLVPPALGRFFEVPILWGTERSALVSGNWLDTTSTLFSYGLPFLLVAYDLLKTRRVHPVTVIGTIGYFVATMGLPLLSGTAVGDALWTTLK